MPVTSQKRILSRSQIAMYAMSAGLTPPDVWVAIAMAESSGDANAVNSIGCVGLWQINQPVHVRNNPTWTVKWLQDPMNNARAAKKIYDSQGFAAWEAYTGPDGRGSDGPWRKYYKGGDSVDQAGFWDMAGEWGIPGAVPGSDFIEHATESVDVLLDAANWVSNPHNWVRVAYGLVGGILIYGGLVVTVTGKLKPLTDQGKQLAAQAPGGKALKGKSAVKAKAAAPAAGTGGGST